VLKWYDQTFVNYKEGFGVEKIIPRPSYAFDTLVVMAMKKIITD